jgi:hypothetical protein
MLLTPPLIAWGDPDDLSAYFQNGTAALTSGVSDPFGGLGAFTLEDNDNAASEYRFKAISYARSGTQVGVVMAKQGTAPVSEYDYFDSTVGTNRCGIRLTWSGGVPTVTIYTGSGTIVGVEPLGGGWYLILVTINGVVAANVNRLRLFGGQATATSTGTTSWYVRNVVLLDYLSPYHAFERPRPGYARAVAPSLARDSWSYGKEYVRRFRLGWVPDQPRGTPQTLVSGWFGDNESVGVNASIQAMLAAGWDQQPLLFVPDRGACSTYWTGYLERPERDWEPAEEPNQDRAVEIELVGSSPLGGY